MADKLTSIKGFGEGDPKPEKKEPKRVDMGGLSVKLRSRKELSDWKRLSPAPNAERGRALVTRHNYEAKSSALNKKMGKGTKSSFGNPSFIKKLEKHKESRRDYM